MPRKEEEEGCWLVLETTTTTTTTTTATTRTLSATWCNHRLARDEERRRELSSLARPQQQVMEPLFLDHELGLRRFGRR